MDLGTCAKLLPILPMIWTNVLTSIPNLLKSEVEQENVTPLVFKSDIELLKYISCYEKSSDLTKKFIEKYWPTIQKASDASGIPKALLTCLLFRESSLWQNITSNAGAVGIAQFKTEGVGTINSIIKAKPYPTNLSNAIANNIEFFNRSNQGYLKSELQNIESSVRDKTLYVAQIAAVLSKIKSAINKSNLIKNKTKDQMKMHSALEIWEADLEKTQRKLNGKYIWEAFYKNEKQKPESFDPKNESQSIIASAVYLKYIHNLMTPDGGWKTKTKKEQFFFTVGAYNAGINGLKDDCDLNKTLDVCMQNLKKNNSETYNHIDSIKNCSEPENFNPMSGTEARKCQG